jgi:hypothetical protein
MTKDEISFFSIELQLNEKYTKEFFCPIENEIMVLHSERSFHGHLMAIQIKVSSVKQIVLYVK